MTPANDPDPRRHGMPEAPMRDTGEGREPSGPGWFVVNAADSVWLERPGGWGPFTRFESGDAEFGDFGLNIHVIRPGERNGHYHGENGQETFLVLSGECLLLVEGEERPMRQWDLFHAPPWTRHIFVGAGDGPCAILMVGARKDPDEIVYEVHPLAVKHNAASAVETTSVKESYGDRPPARPVPFDPGWLG